MKDIRFIWGLPQEDSFMKLKELVTLAPVLVLPNNELPFRLEADGSGIATSVVLSQKLVDNNVWHPIAFLSKALNPVERNYKIHNTEMLAIIRGLEEWRHYLEGARHPVEIWTDLGILPSGPEVKLSTSLMVALPIVLRLYTSPQARLKHG
jgi:hypothetical protein